MAKSGDGRLRVSEPSFGYWAPELHELHVHLPLQALPVGGEERFRPRGVLVDGGPPRYAFWYVDGTAYAYRWVKRASERKLELFVPLPWRPGEEHTLTLSYSYHGEDLEQTVTLRAPERGGVWEESDGGNHAFLVREMAGLARRDEPVEFDLTVEAEMFPDPERMVRATIMADPGVFQEVPCQVYDTERPALRGTYTSVPLVRFRAAVQLSVEPGGEALVVLWHCSGEPREPVDPPILFQGSALGGTVENDCYRIGLDATSGQLSEWHDKRIGVDCHYRKDSGRPGSSRSMSYTPDIYRVGANWSHTDDWTEPQARELRGRVFCETARWGPMHNVPEATSRVTYRFYARRPEVRISSVIRVLEDIDVLGFRNCGMIQNHELYTHAAWPRQDGSVVRLSVEKCLGNDTGACPPARMPFETPWVAFYHEDQHYGLALISTNGTYFNEGPYHANMSNAHRYVSLYNGMFLYTVRSMIFTYCSNIRSYHTPVRAGTIAYEELALLPFTFEGEDEDTFHQVEALRREMLHPLVVVP